MTAGPPTPEPKAWMEKPRHRGRRGPDKLGPSDPQPQPQVLPGPWSKELALRRPGCRGLGAATSSHPPEGQRAGDQAIAPLQLPEQRGRLGCPSPSLSGTPMERKACRYQMFPLPPTPPHPHKVPAVLSDPAIELSPCLGTIGQSRDSGLGKQWGLISKQGRRWRPVPGPPTESRPSLQAPGAAPFPGQALQLRLPRPSPLRPPGQAASFLSPRGQCRDSSGLTASGAGAW